VRGVGLIGELSSCSLTELDLTLNRHTPTLHEMPLTLLPIIFSGPGSNLYPLCDASASTSSASKALLPVANRPLIAFALQNLLSTGLTSCLLLAPSSQHAAISRALSSVRLVPPYSPSVSSDKKKTREVKDEKKTTSIAIVDNLSLSTSDATTMKVELLPLGPYDGKGVDEVAHQEGFRRNILGTAELLRWVASLGKLEANPLVVPVDMINPSMPLKELIDLYISAEASIYGSPTACCALYERAAGDGTGRERERDGEPSR
jgi:translation initiation factor eIF-2B subunit gamma